DRDVRRRLLSDPAYGPVHRFAREATWDTVVSVPMVYHERQVGVVIAYYRRGHDPGDRDVALLRAIADQAAVAVENARLLVEAQGRAALEERQRLARELHDSVSQAIYGIGLGARTARHLLDEDASRLDLRLHAAAGEVLLDICNEGVGFDPRASYPGHLGLRSMRERIARVGGRLAVESAPGRGTCVRAVVPLT
ncbi:MAG: GAF domain-containing protein, partial [Chloroflexi bacterium]|nr:GAF domain-containing protein [Chloroflexota bacterium]